MRDDNALPLVSIIIPARNEEDNILRCLNSITKLAYEKFEVIVVDDGSTDSTSAVVRRFQTENSGIKLIENDELPAGWMGKNHALDMGVHKSCGQWYLFIDADIELFEQSLSYAVDFAVKNGFDLVSLTPRQVLDCFWGKTVQPVIFDILNSEYVYDEINDPLSDKAAANGQFILISKDTYDASGGHLAVRGEVLEDVALAKNVKSSGYRIHFGYGADVAKCRMYSGYWDMYEGWTKNLFLLLGNSRTKYFNVLFRLSLYSLIPFLLISGSLVYLSIDVNPFALTLLGVSLVALAGLTTYRYGEYNVRGYPFDSAFLHPIGCFVVMYFLTVSVMRSYFKIGIKWKGREYFNDRD